MAYKLNDVQCMCLRTIFYNNESDERFESQIFLCARYLLSISFQTNFVFCHFYCTSPLRFALFETMDLSIAETQWYGNLFQSQKFGFEWIVFTFSSFLFFSYCLFGCYGIMAVFCHCYDLFCCNLACLFRSLAVCVCAVYRYAICLRDYGKTKFGHFNSISFHSFTFDVDNQFIRKSFPTWTIKWRAQTYCERRKRLRINVLKTIPCTFYRWTIIII